VELERLQVSRQFPVSIVVADMDFLKGINDRFGHNAGDALLKKTAECMRKAFRAEDVVARIGGDEFGVILPLTEEQPAQDAICRFKQAVKDTGDHHLRLSIGVACSGPDGDLSEVMRIADDRMYKEKMRHRTKIL
jgi:diguanylate cyclase (GGDEF)-like protein